MMKTLLLVFIATSFFSQAFAQEKRKCIFSPKITIKVLNNLPQGSGSLQMHCASKDDDLGNRTLAVGDEFDWTFCDHFLSKTLFFCHLWWGARQKAFDVYDKDLSQGKRHEFYLWAAQSDGIYLGTSDSTQSLVKVYSWD
ncbi:hypothetical protein ABFS82_06G188600 [Erythranthe guttata]|nr:PREDICTED: uncharacterized protein LOC105955401 [Erythranthe guttata]|eukprot:XP_012834570.1 PREDICTED: uncharacterized protein LOC105955401 [Erythranthe guttata]